MLASSRGNVTASAVMLGITAPILFALDLGLLAAAKSPDERILRIACLCLSALIVTFSAVAIAGRAQGNLPMYAAGLSLSIIFSIAHLFFLAIANRNN